MTAGTIGLVLAWLAGWSLLWRVPRLAAPGPPGRRETTISVIIPARDEAATLPTLLVGLLAQEDPATEIIVVDDHSRDATAMVAAAAGARVLHSPDLPPGWTGKTWACWRGASAARGDLLVFLDADTEPGPQLLDRLAAEHAERGGLVSVEPYHRMERASERLSAFFNVVSWMGIGAASARRHRRVTGAFGPCMVMSRTEYLGIGGHRAVRGSVLEDVALARHCRDAGLPVRCLGGRGSVQFRMYPDGIRHLIEGWSKNIAAGAGSTPRVRAVLVFAWITATITVGAAAVMGSVSLVTGETGPPVTVWVLYAVWVLQLGVMLRALGTFGFGSIVGFPVGVTVFLLIFLRSLFLTAVRREVTWKGRSIPVRRIADEQP